MVVRHGDVTGLIRGVADDIDDGSGLDFERVGSGNARDAEVKTAKTVFLSDAVRVELLLEKLTAVKVIRLNRAARAREVLNTARGRPIGVRALDQGHFDFVRGARRRRALLDVDGGRRVSRAARFHVHVLTGERSTDDRRAYRVARRANWRRHCDFVRTAKALSVPRRIWPSRRQRVKIEPTI